MANTLLNPTNLVRAMVKQFENNVSAVMTSKRLTKKEFEIGGWKAGASTNISVPNLFTTRTTQQFSGQDIIERSKSVAVDKVWGVDITGITALQMKMNLESFMDEVMKPKMAVLSAKFESDYLDYIAKHTPNLVGTAGTTPQSTRVYLQAGQKLNENAAPESDRTMHIGPVANTETVNAMTGLFHRDISIEKQFQRGIMGEGVLGFDFYMNQAIPTITTGSRNTDATIITTATSGAVTLEISGLGGNATIAAGEHFTVGTGGTSVYSVNPLTKQTTGQLQQFVVTAAATANGSGVATVPILPGVTLAGPYQNVTRLPTLNDAVTFVGSASTAYPHNLCWYKDAFCFVSIEMDKPAGVDFAAVATYKGISMKIVRDYDIQLDRYLVRTDIYGGFGELKGEWASVVIG